MSTQEQIETTTPIVKALSLAFPNTQFDMDGDTLSFSKEELSMNELYNIATLAKVYRLEAIYGTDKRGFVVRLISNVLDPALLEHCHHHEVHLCVPLNEILNDYQDFEYQPEKNMNDDPEEGTRFEFCGEEEAEVFTVYGIRIFEGERVPELAVDCTSKEAAVKLVDLLKKQKGVYNA